MLDHLLDLSEVAYLPDIDQRSATPFTPAQALNSNEAFDAKAKTADFFESLGVVSDDAVLAPLAQQEATETFKAFIGDDEQARLKAVGALSLPQSVRASVAMLSQYQWDFVTKAQELRTMAVSKIVTLTDSPDPRIQLQALKLLGTVTEVALFTERIEVKKSDVTASTIDDLIRSKLELYASRMKGTDTSVDDAVILDTGGADTPQESATLAESLPEQP